MRSTLATTLILVGAALWAAQAVARSAALDDARVALALDASLLGAFGCRVDEQERTRGASWTLDELSVDMSSAVHREVSGALVLESPDDEADLGLRGAVAAIEPAIRLRCRGVLEPLEITALAPEGDALQLLDAAGRTLLRAQHPHASLDRVSGLYQLFNLDLRVGPELASRAGAPALETAAVGTLAFAAHVESLAALETAPGGCPSAGWGNEIDVVLTELSFVDAADQEGGRVSLSPTALLENGGTTDVPWFRKFTPIDPAPDPLPAAFFGLDQHPYLVWSLWRSDASGRFEQIGVSPLKHAFNATNLDCGCDGFVHDTLYPGCGDRYSFSTNRADSHLGPRDEVEAHLGAWDSCGSHFDDDGNCSPDDSHHGGATPHHRLFVDDIELDLPGHRYFVSAWYLARGDVDIFNSMGWVEIDPVPGALWTFPIVQALRSGSVLDAWVERRGGQSGRAVNRILDTGEGAVQIAARGTTVDERLRFDFVVANHDYDRQVRAISIALPPGQLATELDFADHDQDAGNDWVASRDADGLTWEAPAGNEIDWAMSFRFSFETDGELLPEAVTLEPLEAGAFPAPVFQDLRLIFEDDFESQNKDAWFLQQN